MGSDLESETADAADAAESTDSGSAAATDDDGNDADADAPEIATTVGADSPDDVVTSIVLPAYNEVGNLRPLIEEIVDVVAGEAMAAYRPVEILLVDDGSTDGTADVIRELTAEYDAVAGIFLRRNFGQSAALCAGFDTAAGDYVVPLDADGQNNPADIPMLLDRLGDGYDCVSGWRRDRDDPITKTIPSGIQTYLARFTGPDIHDFGCTMKAYRSEAVAELNLRGEGHRYIPAKLYDRGYKITEEPVDHRPRTHGSTKYGAGRLVRGFVDLAFNIFWNKYSMRPMHIMGGIGLLLLAVGGLIGSHAVFMKYALGDALLPHLPRLVLAVALILFGFQMLMFGILAEMLTKIHYKGEVPYRIQSVERGDDEH
ncbi:glycosyltransferase family 2 protein [Salinarchaeum laminariae]|uniref:glycosyltransferase family 2 protein n=1 Tax=Salinarchaeum laminariae TaxID=869888 RepID=UPI0020BE7327|nr:glycosyltransferase family 2 protein [Salinarchaeum laminariae]